MDNFWAPLQSFIFGQLVEFDLFLNNLKDMKSLFNFNFYTCLFVPQE